MSGQHRIRVSVIVLGDLGRSPRMQYHAMALAEHLADVDVIAYPGSTPCRMLLEHRHIRCFFLQWLVVPEAHRETRVAFWLYAALKVLSEVAQLLWLLLWAVPKPDVVLVQNPPAVPTLWVAKLVAWLRSAKLVIDWHNLGYAMLALRLGVKHPIVRGMRWFEGVLGRQADAHLCVSRAMQAELQRWGLQRVVVLHDRPAEHFVPTPLAVRHQLLRRLRHPMAFPNAEKRLESAKAPDQTFMTVCRQDAAAQQAQVQLRPDRPALLVSPTSWTADEDFDLLLDAIVRCESLIQAHEERLRAKPFPSLLLLITGKGPLRDHYEVRIQGLPQRKIHVRTMWLTFEDYSLLLGAADLGLCLHRSASGLDLPMKVADMMGAGLPVCALDYGSCLAEQIKPGTNSLLFRTSEQLARQLYDMFHGFPDHTPRLDQLRRGSCDASDLCWLEGWRQDALPVFTNLSAQPC